MITHLTIGEVSIAFDDIRKLTFFPSKLDLCGLYGEYDFTDRRMPSVTLSDLSNEKTQDYPRIVIEFMDNTTMSFEWTRLEEEAEKIFPLVLRQINGNLARWPRPQLV